MEGHNADTVVLDEHVLDEERKQTSLVPALQSLTAMVTDSQFTDEERAELRALAHAYAGSCVDEREREEPEAVQSTQPLDSFLTQRDYSRAIAPHTLFGTDALHFDIVCKAGVWHFYCSRCRDLAVASGESIPGRAMQSEDFVAFAMALQQHADECHVALTTTLAGGDS
jgi:hypothetical protein